MAEKSADIQTLAPRVHVLEDLTNWLKDNRGEGGGGTTDEKLWKATLTGAVTSATWGNEPWLATNLIYGPDSPNQMSMHQTIFGLNSEGALRCQDGKGFFGWIFSTDETRWQYGPENRDRSMAGELFGPSNSGWVHTLRAANLNLMSSIFKSPEYVGDYTIIDRIETQAADLEELAGQAQEAIGDVQSEVAHQATLNETAHANLQSQIDSLRARLNAGGL